MFPEKFATHSFNKTFLYISKKQVDLRNFEKCMYRVKHNATTCAGKVDHELPVN